MEKVKCNKCGKDNMLKSKYCMYCGFELPVIEVAEPVLIQNEKPKNKLNKKTTLGITIGVVTTIIVSFLINNLFFSYNIDKFATKMASEFNKTCPFMVDSETRLDNVIALPDNTFQYNYTLINQEKNLLDTSQVKKYLEQNIINNIKTNPQMKYQRDNEWNMNYYYKDKHGNYLFMIEVTPKMYK